MKRIYILFAVGIVLIAFACYGFMFVGGKPPAPAGDTYEYITMFLTFEQNDNDGDYDIDGDPDCSSGDTSGAYAGAAEVNGDQKQVGTYALDCPTAADYMEFTTDANTIAPGSSGRVGFYHHLNAEVANTLGVLKIEDDGDNYLQIRITDDGTNYEYTLFSKIGGDAIANVSTNSNFTEGTWYWVELNWYSTTTTITLEIFDTSGNSIESINDTAGFTGFTTATIQLGEFFSQPADHSFDNVIFADSYEHALVSLRDNTTCQDLSGCCP